MTMYVYMLAIKAELIASEDKYRQVKSKEIEYN